MTADRPRPESVIFVIDDDVEVREALKDLFSSVGLHTELFGSTSEFLRAVHPDVPSCLVLDIRLPGLSGLEFQAKLAEDSIQIPIVFITGHGDIPMTVKAIKAGAVEFLTKPFREQDLLDAVLSGLDRDRTQRDQHRTVAGLRERFELAHETGAGNLHPGDRRPDEQADCGRNRPS